MIIIFFLSSVTFAYVGTIGMGTAPTLVESHEQNNTGALMSFGFLSGVFIGTLVGKGVTSLASYFKKRSGII